MYPDSLCQTAPLLSASLRVSQSLRESRVDYFPDTYREVAVYLVDLREVAHHQVGGLLPYPIEATKVPPT
jgi:hypothetical protein